MMAAEPKFLLLDEPFSALDTYLKEKLMQEMMTYLSQFKKGVIMVSHSRDEVYQMCTDTAIMHQGILETVGKTKEILIIREPSMRRDSQAVKIFLRADKLHDIGNLCIRVGYKTYFPETDRDSINLTHVGIRAHEICPIVSKMQI